RRKTPPLETFNPAVALAARPPATSATDHGCSRQLITDISRRAIRKTALVSSQTKSQPSNVHRAWATANFAAPITLEPASDAGEGVVLSKPSAPNSAREHGSPRPLQRGASGCPRSRLRIPVHPATGCTIALLET
ncbi:hypothetical protein CERZMDRAFT_105955, partial [Cercospora zeae-maydis SCOH1-5]